MAGEQTPTVEEEEAPAATEEKEGLNLDAVSGKKGLTLQDLIDAVALSEDSGIGTSRRAKKKLRKAGVRFDEEGNAVYDGEILSPSKDSKEFNQEDFEKLHKTIEKPNGRPSQMRTRYNGLLADRARQKTEDYYNEFVAPNFARVRETLDDLMKNPTGMTADEIAALRSDLASTTQAQVESQLGRVGAVLGLRGLDPGSPAAAAFVARSVQEADGQIADLMRRFNLDLGDRERQGKAAGAQFMQQLTTAQLGAKSAVDSGNLDYLFKANDNVSALLEAIHAEQNQPDDKTNWGGMVLAAGGAVAGGIIGGPKGAAIGAQAGSAAGSMLE